MQCAVDEDDTWTPWWKGALERGGGAQGGKGLCRTNVALRANRGVWVEGGSLLTGFYPEGSKLRTSISRYKGDTERFVVRQSGPVH